jgi:hypothetical protein
MYSNAKYYKDAFGNLAGISVEINGVACHVPLDPANSDYAAIMALVAEGKLTIGAAQ